MPPVTVMDVRFGYTGHWGRLGRSSSSDNIPFPRSRRPIRVSMPIAAARALAGSRSSTETEKARVSSPAPNPMFSTFETRILSVRPG